MDLLTASVPSASAGRTAPASSPDSHLPRIASGHRPPELDDADWLRRRLARDGERAIALELNVARGTVRAARARLGIPPHGRGLRRGIVTSLRPPAPNHPSTIAKVVARFALEAQASGPAPTPDLVLARLAAADTARKLHDRTSEKSAWIALAVAAALVAEQLERVERAA